MRFIKCIPKQWYLLPIILLAIVPYVAPRFYVELMTQIMIFALFALSYNICLCHGGMLSLGHGAFYGIGAYSLALLLKKASIPFLVALLTAPVFSGIAGVIIGYFLVRVGFWYFATLTIAFGQLIWVLCYKWYGLTGGI